MQTELPYTAADGLCISRVAARQAFQPIIDPNSCSSVTKVPEPIPKEWRLNDYNTVPSVHNSDLAVT